MVVENIKAVLFDVDDTLFDRNTAQKMTLDIIIERLPHVFDIFDTERVMNAFMESDRAVTEAYEAGAPFEGLREARSGIFLKLLDINEDVADTITEIYVRDYPKVNASVPGAIELVKELSGRFQIGVVSNGLPDVQYQKLESMGISSFVSCVVLSEELGIRKPDPRIFHHAAGLLQRQPSDCLYVGDSYTSDVIGAKAAGMVSCWFNKNNSSYEEKDPEPDFEISNLEELTGILL
ncbi:HAD family hydrolase [Chloroflexota bacterium]